MGLNIYVEVNLDIFLHLFHHLFLWSDSITPLIAAKYAHYHDFLLFNRRLD